MNAILEALRELHTRFLAEADEQDGYAQGEILAGNKVKEQAYRSAAAGLRMAADMTVEEIENQKAIERIDAMTPEEVRADLIANGYTDERIDALVARCRETVEAAMTKANTEGSRGRAQP